MPLPLPFVLLLPPMFERAVVGAGVVAVIVVVFFLEVAFGRKLLSACFLPLLSSVLLVLPQLLLCCGWCV